MCDHPNREAAMTITHRHDDGSPRVWCDPCLEPLVTALNDGGLPTIASCCGHGNHYGSVILADDTFLLHVSRSEADRVGARWAELRDDA